MLKELFRKEIYIPFDNFKTMRRIEVKILDKYLNLEGDDVVLDIGCGTGYWTESICKRCTSIGIDLLKLDLSIAQKYHSGTQHFYARANAEKLPFGNETFSKIFGLCSVEHIPDNQSAFSEFSRCLQTGGTIALTLDSLNYPRISSIDRDKHAMRYNVAHFYTVENIDTLLKNFGLKLDAYQYFISSPVAHYLHKLELLNRKFQYLSFPISYPLTRISDKFHHSNENGWGLAIKATKM